MSFSKYVVGRIDGTTAAVIFPDCVAHSAMRKTFTSIKSAGFYTVGVDADGELKVSVFGESISLGIKSQEQDAMYVAQALNIRQGVL